MLRLLGGFLRATRLLGLFIGSLRSGFGFGRFFRLCLSLGLACTLLIAETVLNVVLLHILAHGCKFLIESLDLSTLIGDGEQE